MAGLSYLTYNIGQIDALRGNNKFEQQIKYTFNSSGGCVKQDTTYVKIN